MAVCGLTMLYFINPVNHTFSLKCPFKLITGLSCPGCGFQRALHALLHGKLLEAARYNLYLVYAGPYALALLIQNYFLTGRCQELVKSVLEHKYVVNFYIYSFIVWMIVRNILKI